MKIALLLHGFPILSQTFILNQITGLLDLGCQLEIFCRHAPQPDVTHPDIEKYHLMQYVHQPPRAADNQFLRCLTALKLFAAHFVKHPAQSLHALALVTSHKEVRSLRWLDVFLDFPRRNFDIIYCHFGDNGRIGALLKRLCPHAKLVTVFHGVDMSMFLSRFGDRYYHDLFHAGDLFLPISDHWRQKLIALQCPPSRIVVHRMGVDPDRFPCRPRSLQPDQTLTILSVGRLVEKKGHEYLIRALAPLAPRYPHLRLVLAGDGPLKDHLESLITQLGLRNIVRLTGPLDQTRIIQWLDQAHLFVLPSITAADHDQEGIPVVLMEAMACGLPIVSTWHTGIPELVRDGQSGFLVPEKDTLALTQKIQFLIDHPHLWPSLGQTGRNIVESRYHIHRLNPQLHQLFQNLLTAPH